MPRGWGGWIRIYVPLIFIWLICEYRNGSVSLLEGLGNVLFCRRVARHGRRRDFVCPSSLCRECRRDELIQAHLSIRSVCRSSSQPGPEKGFIWYGYDSRGMRLTLHEYRRPPTFMPSCSIFPIFRSFFFFFF